MTFNAPYPAPIFEPTPKGESPEEAGCVQNAGAAPLPSYIEYVLSYIAVLLRQLARRPRIIKAKAAAFTPTQAEIKTSERLYRFNALLIKRGVLTPDMARSAPQKSGAALTVSWHRLDAQSGECSRYNGDSALSNCGPMSRLAQGFRCVLVSFVDVSALILQAKKPPRYIPP